MTKILLVNPPVFNDIGKCKSETPPLSLLYLAGYLEKYGFREVKVIDADMEMITWPALEELFIKEKPDIVGVGGSSFVLPALIKTAEIAKRCLPNSLVVAGGFGPSKEPGRVLELARNNIDLIIIGEGEQTLLDVVQRRSQGRSDFGDIAGLAFLDKTGQLIVTETRGYIMDLDSIPWPAFHLLTSDFLKYPGAPLGDKKYGEMKKPIATVLAARGCPHRCFFCSLGSKLWRKRTPKDIVDEIEFYKNKFGVKSIQIYDDEFIGMTPKQNEWVEEICEEIIKRRLNLPWLIQGRCSPYLELKTLKKMREAGCCWIWWGVESGSQRLLDEVIHKDIKIADVYRAFDLAKQAGIKSLIFIMVGFPGETPEDVGMSVKLIKKIKPDDLGIHVTTPFPGSQLRKYLEEHDLLEQKLEKLEDYYTLDTDRHTHFHTKEMTAAEIEKYYKFIVFKFGEHGFWYFLKFGIVSLATIDGWKKLFKRANITVNYLINWLRFNYFKINK